ncbi:MAG: NirD/YgiW/YdeI family stress tolerance protein [Zoogloeaceae bacterium]|nr:NirD/YgiW/YdeI family stress tolerance protein [Zoogloeaceae bacterium]
MKLKHLICLVGLLAGVGLPVYAQQGGYTGTPAVTTVAEAKKLSDDAPVVLRGKIERFLGDEKYLFTDSTGNVIIEIDDDIWGTQKVGSNDVVEISGEMDKELLREIEVDVKAIRKL